VFTFGLSIDMNYHRWTREEEEFLKAKYTAIGDTYLAELFNRNFPKEVHYWTKKHIEKKRKHLGLKRTKEQESNLRKLNNKDGRHFKAWDKRGRAKDGEIRIWKDRKYIKHKGKFVLYNRLISKAKAGQVARQTPSGVKVISRAEHAVTNRRMWQSYTPELKETVKLLNQLKKLTHGKEN